MKKPIIAIDLRPEKLAEKTTGVIQEVAHSLHRKAVRGELKERCKAIAVTAAIATLTPASVFAYVPGTIMIKAQPIIQVLKDAAEPLAYGMYIWSAIKYIQGQRGEAKEIFKAVTFGFIAIQLLPWAFDIVKSVGVTPTTVPITPPPTIPR